MTDSYDRWKNTRLPVSTSIRDIQMIVDRHERGHVVKIFLLPACICMGEVIVDRQQGIQRPGSVSSVITRDDLDAVLRDFEEELRPRLPVHIGIRFEVNEADFMVRILVGAEKPTSWWRRAARAVGLWLLEIGGRKEA